MEGRVLDIHYLLKIVETVLVYISANFLLYYRQKGIKTGQGGFKGVFWAC